MRGSLLLISLVVATAASDLELNHFQILDSKTKHKIESLAPARLSKGDLVPTQGPELSLQFKNAINNRLISLLENAREYFETGSDSIPPLDPFRWKSIGPVRVEYGSIFRAHIIINDVLVIGLRQFIIENLNFRIVGLTLEFDFTVPTIAYTSSYGIDAKIAWIFPWRPGGVARINAYGVKAIGSARLGTHDGKLLLRAFEVKFDVLDTYLDIEGLLGNGLINQTLNWLLNLFTDSFIQEQRHRISEAASERMFEVINDAISQYSLSDLLGRPANKE